MYKLKSVELTGFKSLKNIKVELGQLNVLIGSNGAGKSNFISFFRMLNHIMSNNFQNHVGVSGGADSLLNYGSKVTNQTKSTLSISTPAGENKYHMRLASAANDTLIFADEAISFTRDGAPEKKLASLGAGHKETMLTTIIEDMNENANERNVRTAAVIKNIMNRWRVYHFHDTSPEAKIKKQSYIDDNYYLRDDAGNIAAYLYMLQKTKPDYYKRIVSTIKKIAPFFGDFILNPSKLNPDYITLNWREKNANPDVVFGPHQLSDGTLRMISLITLLLQPDLPNMIIIDEPELGLHPYAITILASLLQSASNKAQLIVSTQSVSLINQLELDDLIIVDREKGHSVFKRLNNKDYIDWLEEYSVGELWEKNVIGGRPSYE